MVYDVPVTHDDSGTVWTLEVRVFDDGVAYRYRVPGQGLRRVTGESTAWCLPAKTKVWIQTNTANYEGNYHEVQVEGIPVRDDKGDIFIGCPVTAELEAGGYALITEACLSLRNWVVDRRTEDAD